jgi:hypothetical protein
VMSARGRRFVRRSNVGVCVGFRTDGAETPRLSFEKSAMTNCMSFEPAEDPMRREHDWPGFMRNSPEDHVHLGAS